ncbi:glucose dehydrogenase [FAD, quinone]-like [Macrosteles quadrilineatus]|uniref:glucose dehydrogenase [FAD, quinone]-like n=1 Tax=Macrosteles quadrilineatus TaxID=74068 RepID=UPI0023E14530|nr:glucose dehydrogenase [FAD, quinone]-like [Macrosteles quadrilineatus]
MLYWPTPLIILIITEHTKQESIYPTHYDPEDGETFDFIVVGAGSAGSVVANRLTEPSDWSVLVIEAGYDPPLPSDMPVLFPWLQKTEIDWRYKTEPGFGHCLGMEDQRCYWPRGKVLGGTSVINFMIYVRGNAKDYDGWARDGNVGWAYKDVLPYFKKSEDIRAEEVLDTPGYEYYHGKGGYLKVETWEKEEVQPLVDHFISGMHEIGHNLNKDCNGATQTGYATLQATQEDGRRCNTAKAFLAPIKKRNNLKICKGALATKILISEDGKTASGIEFTNRDGVSLKVFARKEVILSAGAVNSPQLLMLSGIGPRKHLEEHNITVVQDLPVGENLQDHVLTYGMVITLNYTKPDEGVVAAFLKYVFKKQTHLSGFGLGSLTAFIDLIDNDDNPDIQMYFVDFSQDFPGLKRILSDTGLRKDIRDQYAKLHSESYIVLVLTSLLNPYSKGRISLKSKDPTMQPKIEAGYFSNYKDIQTLLTTYDIATSLVKTTGLRRVNAELHEINVTECNRYPFASIAYRDCSLRYLTATTYHPSGTCKMGPASSSDSVVDPYLRVKGVNNLRVIDASIMPNIVRGNINAPVIMIAEKGSDLIKQTWLPKSD